MQTFTAYIEKDAKTGLYVAIVPQIQGVHTQAETLDELRKNLVEAVELCLDDKDVLTRIEDAHEIRLEARDDIIEAIAELDIEEIIIDENAAEKPF
ncbi:MAG: type II toxin-antitoxin system HicB family antitoxin [Theionarchaea archaeon]|nr:type II toxin-antitoxin system HicB family antitoxin [Theionarchaea archaeon]